MVTRTPDLNKQHLSRWAGWGKEKTILVIAALVAALAPIPAAIVEECYSQKLYTRLQPAFTTTSNQVPLALIDLLGVAVLIAWVAALVRDGRTGGWRRVCARGAARTVVWAAALYLVFLLVWGFNYRRAPLVSRVSFDAAAVTPDAAVRLASTTVDQLNRLHAVAHAQGWAPSGTIDPALAAAFDRTTRELGASRGFVVARPKQTLLNVYFKRAGVEGMIDPFFLETLVASDLLPFERPFTVAHEWSHLAGIANEGEANFGGWVTCMHGAPRDQYSGWLFLYSEVSRAIRPEDRSAIAARLDAGPRADLRAIRDRIVRDLQPRVAAAGWRVYDSYLKANRVEAGAASYAEVVRLLLGVRFADGWRPLRPGEH